MTADWARLPHELLAKMSNRIQQVDGINGRLRHHQQAPWHDRVGVGVGYQHVRSPSHGAANRHSCHREPLRAIITKPIGRTRFIHESEGGTNDAR
jgi:hypothetical protein